MVHSEFGWKNKWIKKIFIVPETHKFHHAIDSKYFDKNFGILTIWDRLFGTYYDGDEHIDHIGVEEKQNFNTGHPVTEMIDVFLRWLWFKK